MKICIYGVGAIGGFIGSRLASAGNGRISAVARGATLKAMQRHGWRLRQGGEVLQRSVIATNDPASLGIQDVIVIAVKGPDLSDVAARIAPMLGPETIVLPAMNGVPWWFGEGIPALAGGPLQSVDPGGVIADAIPIHHVIGCVVHASAFSPEPGIVEHRMGQGLIIGEARGGNSFRADRLRALLTSAGFDVKLSPTIRQDIWYKLWGNMTMNPVSAITGATIDRVLGDPLVRAFCSAAMAEAAQLGARIGCAVDQSPEERHDITAHLGRFKTSMLHDVEAGRGIELDSIVTVVYEMARRVGLATPNIDALLGLTRLFAQVHGLYPQAVAATENAIN